MFWKYGSGKRLNVFAAPRLNSPVPIFCHSQQLSNRLTSLPYPIFIVAHKDQVLFCAANRRIDVLEKLNSHLIDPNEITLKPELLK
ncbi:MAG: hypothetical protein K6C08_04545 [Oscillospiraceae bacterium]|nr:hypothetical protein [Oscillospiraceae bacterium]